MAGLARLITGQGGEQPRAGDVVYYYASDSDRIKEAGHDVSRLSSAVSRLWSVVKLLYGQEEKRERVRCGLTRAFCVSRATY